MAVGRCQVYSIEEDIFHACELEKGHLGPHHSSWHGGLVWDDPKPVLAPPAKAPPVSLRVVYIAGPYTGKHHDHRSFFEIDRNIMWATEAAAELAKRRIPFFCPHSHSAHFEVITPDVPSDYWYKLDLFFLEACHAILMLPGWDHSTGARQEKKLAEEWGFRVFYHPIDLHELEAWAHEGRPEEASDGNS